MSLPLDHSLAKDDDSTAEFLAGPYPMSYDPADACLIDQKIARVTYSGESYNAIDILLGSPEPCEPVNGTYSVTSEAIVNQEQPDLDFVTSDIIGSAAALSGIIPVEDQFDQGKRNFTDHFLESPIGDENPSCENDSGDVLFTKEIFGQVSSSEHESTGVSVEPESVNHPSTTECGVMTEPDEPMSKKVMVVRSEKAQKSYNKRAKENGKFARLRFIFNSLYFLSHVYKLKENYPVCVSNFGTKLT